MIPWLIFAVIVVPLVVIAFVVARRRTASGERPVSASDEAGEGYEREFAEAEAYEAEWHAADKERFHQERLP